MFDNKPMYKSFIPIYSQNLSEIMRERINYLFDVHSKLLKPKEM